MIIKKQKTTIEFSPIKIEITIESEQELDAINEMCFYNSDIPVLVGNPHMGSVETFLDYLRKEINKQEDE